MGPTFSGFCLAAAAAIAACQGSPSMRPRADATPDATSIAGPAGGCRTHADCSSDAYCEFTPGLCGAGKRAGSCRPRPAACTEPYAPACGCDGHVYESPCSAHAAGVDLAVTGGCKEAIRGYAPCGRSYCDVKIAYCEVFLSDVREIPTDYFCRPLPPGCRPGDGSARTCDCFPADTRCRSFCGPLPTAPGAEVGFHLTCQGQRPPAE